MGKKLFDSFVEGLVPFAWDVNKDTERVDYFHKHSILISYVRFYEVYLVLKELLISNKKIVDIGPFPGSMIKLLAHFFENYEYIGVGLGFTDEYKSGTSMYGGQLFDAELDPSFCKINSVLDIGREELIEEDADVVLFLDTIEHIVNPVFTLDLINKMLKKGGSLIITTDNISALGYTFNMLFHGSSPNVHPIRSSLIYNGEWRPHHREFSRDELLFYINHCGFEVVSHKYFDRKQGNFYFDKSGKVKENPHNNSFIRSIKNILEIFLPHLKNHHIIHVKKITNYQDQCLMRPQNTKDINKWNEIRSEYNLL
jgi:SAM-dependent methyltransferase